MGRPRPKNRLDNQSFDQAGENSNKTRAFFNELIDRRYQNYQCIYTDGSVADENVGIGIYSQDSELSLQLPPELSIFSAEAAALLRASSSITPNSNNTIIFTDSASVLSALESGKSDHALVQKLELSSLSKPITYCWIPGHCGISGNEKADSLANIGRAAPVTDIEIPSSDASRSIKTKLRLKWEEVWLNNQQPFLRRIKNTTLPWKDNANRENQRCLTRLRIGHTKLTHNFLIERKEPPVCETCNENITVEHLLLNCRKYNLIRDQIKLSDSIRTILSEDVAEEEKVLAFMKQTNLIELI